MVGSLQCAVAFQVCSILHVPVYCPVFVAGCDLHLTKMDKNQFRKAKPNMVHKDLRVTIKDAFIEAHTCLRMY